jgi:hypothetical protein
MTDFPESLWPNDLVSAIPAIPLTLVKEQASHLGRITNNIVEARVRTRVDEDGDFWIIFSITAPALGNYEYKLFSMFHGAELYPIHQTDRNGTIQDEEALKAYLRDLFASPTTVNVVRALVAQARSSSGTGENEMPF